MTTKRWMGLLMMGVLSACGASQEEQEAFEQTQAVVSFPNTRRFQTVSMLAIAKDMYSGDYSTNWPACATTSTQKTVFTSFYNNTDKNVNDRTIGSSPGSTDAEKWNNSQASGSTRDYRAWSSFQINATCASATAVPSVTISNQIVLGGVECPFGTGSFCSSTCPFDRTVYGIGVLSTKTTVGTSSTRVGFRLTGEPDECVEQGWFSKVCVRNGSLSSPPRYQKIFTAGYVTVTCSSNGPVAVFTGTPGSGQTPSWSYSSFPNHNSWLFDMSVTTFYPKLVSYNYKAERYFKDLFALPNIPTLQ